MSSDPAQRSSYDLIIVGGGIAGAGVARDAALRGLATLVIDKREWGWATSSRSSRLIHGGIRYLENAWTHARAGRWRQALTELRYVRLALRECRTLERLAPDLVRPIELVIPLYRGGPRRPATVRLGARLYALLAALSGDAKWPRLLRGPRQVSELLPGLRTEGLTGGIIIHDRTTDDRALVRATIGSAVAWGAHALERTELLSVRRGADGLFTVRARLEDGSERSWACRAVVDATGPWADRTAALGQAGPEPLIEQVAGAHIEITSFTGRSVILEAKDGRVFFMIEQGGRARVGTTERACGDPDGVSATREEIEYLLASLRHYFPERAWGLSEVLSADAGIRPLARSSEGEGPTRMSREHRIITTPDGVTHLTGVKLTDHRRAAEETLDRLARSGVFRGVHVGSCRTSRVPLSETPRT
ncbi:MAG: Aerobic glycerol-3-phosphate dehydrogenase [Candidatus Omnitrophica bacterium]|nr:Aerobic glycerol-3-phosphate dehydrogenase [Candidatus Omnitrophota bacterium]